MLNLIVKAVVSAVLIVAATEAGKRSTLLGGLLVSMPLTSVIALTWLYAETKDRERVAAMTTDILWLVVPSLVLFLILPPMLRRGMHFALAMTLSCLATAAAYYATLEIVKAVRSPGG